MYIVACMPIISSTLVFKCTNQQPRGLQLSLAVISILNTFVACSVDVQTACQTYLSQFEL